MHADGNTAGTVPSFEDWLAEQGVTLHGIRSGHVSDGARGVVAEQSIPEDGLLLQVPEAALITNRAAYANARFAAAVSSASSNPTPLQTLAAFLLCELAKGPASRWAPYLRQLPPTYTTFFTWSAQDIAALQVEYAMREAARSCEALHEEWQSVRPLLKALGLEKRWTGIGAWQWAASSLTSRTMHVPFDEAGALTPFGDLHNYRAPSPPFIPHIEGVSGLSVGDGGPSGDGMYNEAAAEYRLYTRTLLRPGDQVYLQYGCYTNLELLEHYGFQLADNPHDTALLPPAALACALGEGALAALPPQQGALHRCGVPTWDLLQALRLATASPKELRSGRHLAAEGKPISAAGDIRVFELLGSLCTGTLHLLPTSVAEDEAQLATVPEEQQRLRLALTWRISHKQILHRGQDVARQALQHLQSG